LFFKTDAEEFLFLPLDLAGLLGRNSREQSLDTI
jgi:hypothetical protein